MAYKIKPDLNISLIPTCRNLAKEWANSEKADYFSELINCFSISEQNKIRFKYYLRKYLKKCVAQTFRYETNNAMLVIANKNDTITKSGFLQWLFDISKKHNKTIQNVDSYLNVERLLRRKFAVLLDEMPYRFKYFSAIKYHIATIESTVYNKSIRNYEAINRTANFAATTSREGIKQPGFILKNDMPTRKMFVVLEIDSINHDKYKRIPISRLWGQIAAETIEDINADNRDNLSYNIDHADMYEHNSKYVFRD